MIIIGCDYPCKVLPKCEQEKAYQDKHIQKTKQDL